MAKPRDKTRKKPISVKNQTYHKKNAESQKKIVEFIPRQSRIPTSKRMKKLSKKEIAKAKEIEIINDKFYRTFVIGDPMNPPLDCCTDFDVIQKQTKKSMTTDTNDDDNEDDEWYDYYKDDEDDDDDGKYSSNSAEVLEWFRPSMDIFKPI